MSLPHCSPSLIFLSVQYTVTMNKAVHDVLQVNVLSKLSELNIKKKFGHTFFWMMMMGSDHFVLNMAAHILYILYTVQCQKQ